MPSNLRQLNPEHVWKHLRPFLQRFRDKCLQLQLKSALGPNLLVSGCFIDKGDNANLGTGADHDFCLCRQVQLILAQASWFLPRFEILLTDLNKQGCFVTVGNLGISRDLELKDLPPDQVRVQQRVSSQVPG